MKIIAALIVVFFTLPINIYLWYKILTLVQATDLMWFLFFAYVPLTLFAAIVGQLLVQRRD